MKLEYCKKLKDLHDAHIIDTKLLSDILKAQGENLINFNKRMKGIDFEEEVLIVLNALKIVKSLKRPDESVNNIFKTETTDLDIELNDGRSFYLEIKSELYKKPEVKFSDKLMQKYVNIAKKDKKPVYFLVNIYGWWMLFDYQYVQDHKNKVTIEDEKNSKLYEVLGLQSYIFFKGTKIKTVYSKNEDNSLIMNEKYGGIVSQELYFDKKKIFRCKGQNSAEWKNVIVLEALHERLYSSNVQVSKEDGDYFIEELEIVDKNQFVCIQESEMILSQVYHSGMSGSEELRKENDYKLEHFIPIQLCRFLLFEMYKKGMYFIKLHNGVLYEL